MRLMWWRATVVCQQWVELVTDYLDGALPRRLVAAIDRHLAGCEHCHEYLDQMRATIRITGTLRDEELPDELLDALQAAFEEVQRENP
jgi:anti-sigma factor RsiW